jgi:ubiquinone biosynthesis monooxygenase Coq7
MSARRKRPAMPGVRNTADTKSMIRVDHAGEYGAVRIYEGQLAVFGDSKSETAQAIRKMAEQEQEHLAAFDKLVNERRVRPTAMYRLGRLPAYAIGAAPAIMGQKAPLPSTDHDV